MDINPAIHRNPTGSYTSSTHEMTLRLTGRARQWLRDQARQWHASESAVLARAIHAHAARLAPAGGVRHTGDATSRFKAHLPAHTKQYLAEQAGRARMSVNHAANQCVRRAMDGT